MTRLWPFCLLLGIALAGCFPRNIDPPLYAYRAPELAIYAARAHAHGIGGRLMYVANTGSMEPLLRGGDIIVVEPYDYKLLRVGQVIVYVADWQPIGAPPVTHRIVYKDKLGLVMSGDHNEHSEPGYRVTATNYIGLVAGIYRVSQ